MKIDIQIKCYHPEEEKAYVCIQVEDEHEYLGFECPKCKCQYQYRIAEKRKKVDMRGGIK